ncbi:MAG: extracellular solute-binding protein [Kiritimatiellae bacterium]|nr:extracellular solute-binding protein [Kiritimatiellia bacterium]MDW8458775.1 extracellular solute-binding protein [Verrucomicrobiota bacterium]
MTVRRALHAIRGSFALIVVAAVYVWSIVAIASYRARTAPADAIVIRMSHWQLEASVREAIDRMAAEYRAKVNPRVYVIQDAIPESTYGQWVSTQLMGGTAPDIVQCGLMLPPNIWLSYYQRYFIPLGRYVEKPNPHNAGTELDGVPLRKTYKDGMRTAYVDEMQEYMSIPLSQFGSRFFYNKDLFRKLTGLEEPPLEWREFQRVCEIIKSQRAPDGKFYIPIASSGYHFGMMSGLMWEPLTYRAREKADFNRDGFVGNDEQFVAFRTGRLTFDYLPFRARFKMIEEISRYFQSGYTGLTRDEAVFLFAQQKAVFMATGTWDARSLQEQAKGQFEVGVMGYPFPTPDDPFYGPVAPARPREQVGTGFQFGITRTSKHPDIALDFLLFLASKGGNQLLNQIIGWIPAIQGCETDPLLRAFEPNIVGTYSAMNFFLGGETGIKWNQLHALFQVGQITYEEFAEQFTPFYLERGLIDYKEQTRDWRRGMQRNELFLAGIRARALFGAEGAEANTEWIRYRSLTSNRQVWAEIDRSRQMKLMEQGIAKDAAGPYEYKPAVLAAVKARLEAKR